MSNKAKGAHWIKPERTKFRADPKVQEWLASLHPSTRVSYEYDLYRVCSNLNFAGSEFLQAVESDSKTVSRKVKTYLKQLEQQYNGLNAARCKAAIVSYLNFFEVALPLTGLLDSAAVAEFRVGRKLGWSRRKGRRIEVF